MSNERMELPESLARELARDLAPVSPLMRFEVRAALVAAVALACGATFLSFHGLRADLAALPGPIVLSVFLLRVAGGAVLVFMAMREAIPAAGWTDRGRSVALFATAAALIVLPEAFARVTGFGGTSRLDPLICFPLVLLVSVPSLLVAWFLLMRAWPLRAAGTGMLAGLGSGVLSGAVLFIACDNPSALHGLAMHESAALAVALLGAAGGWAIGVLHERSSSVPRSSSEGRGNEP